MCVPQGRRTAIANSGQQLFDPFKQNLANGGKFPLCLQARFASGHDEASATGNVDHCGSADLRVNQPIDSTNNPRRRHRGRDQLRAEQSRA